MEYKQNKTNANMISTQTLSAEPTHLSLELQAPKVQLKDIILDISVYDAVRTLKDCIPNYNPYWDEDGGFVVADSDLFPLSRFATVLSTNNLPPIMLTRTPNGLYKYEDGRHRHCRLLLQHACEPEAELEYGVDFIMCLTKESGQQILYKKVADTKFLVYDKNKNVVSSVCENDFARRVLPVIEIMGYTFKYKNCTRKEAREIAIKIITNPTFKREGLGEKLQGLRDGFVDFIDGAGFIVKSVAALGKTTRQINDAYALLKEKYLKPAINSPIVDFLSKYGAHMVRLFASLITFVKDGSCSFMTLVTMVVDVAAMGKDLVFKKESLDTLLLLGLGSLIPSGIMDILRRLQVLTSKKLFDENGCMFEVLTLISSLMSSLMSLLPECFLPFAEQFLSVLGLQEYIVIMQSRSLVDEWRKDLKNIIDSGFRTRVKDFHAKSKDIISKRFFSRNKNLSDACEDFERVYKAVCSYEETSRQEPCCFVFEGPPGCRKSVTVNKVIEILGMPHYAHTVKCAEDSKDWYDSYNNENIFYMDDVGQMGVSQWRSLINWVSAVKLPLDCAEAKLKDTKFFNSEILLLTTNNFMHLQGFTAKDCISSPEALWRRGYVFDFHNVRGNGINTEGYCIFKHYDINSRTFVERFPLDFVNFCNMRDIELPTRCDAGNQNDFLSWINAIITGMSLLKKEQLKDNTLEAQDVANIRRANPFLRESSRIYDYLKDYLDFGVEVLTTFLSDSMSLLQEQPVYFGLGVCLGSLLLCLVYKIHTLTKEGGIVSMNTEKDDFKYLDLDKEHTMLKKVANQMFEAQIAIEMPDTSVYYMYCMACVSGRYVIIPLHIMEHLGLSDRVQLTLYKGPMKDNYRYIDNMLVTIVWRDINNDVGILKMRDGFPTPFPSLAKCFKNTPGNIVGLVHPGKVVELKGILEKNPFKHCPLTYAVTFKERDFVEIKNPLLYGIHGEGMCGVLVITDTGCIRGMHVAGSEEKNLGAAMLWDSTTIDCIREILDSHDNGLKLDVNISPKQLIETSAIKIDAQLSNFVPKHSNIIESPLHGIFPISRFPAELSVNGPHTVKDCFNPSKIPIAPVRLTELDYAASVLRLYFEDYEDLSEAAIVCGDEDLARMNPKSSNGMFVLKEKKDCFDYENSTFTDQFRALYNEFELKMNTGNVSPSDIAWTETLKDELRVPNKLPRSFRVCPVTMQVLTKKCFGNLVRKIVKERWFNEIMIGLNPFSEWKQVKESIDGDMSWAADVKWYDKLMRSQAAMTVADVMMSFYKGANPIAARNVLEYIAYCYVVVNDDNYILTHTLPSGSWLTAIFNSLVNRVYTLMWYHREMSKIKRHITPYDFHRDVVDLVYGDDRANRCKNPKYSQSLNALTMLEFFTSIGMDMTDSHKKQIITPFQPLSELTFLKRSFVYHPKLGEFTCPLDLTTIYSSISWVDSKKEDLIGVMQDKISAFQREIFLHHDRYEQDVMVLENSCKLRNVYFKRLPVSYLIKLYKDGEYDLEYNKKYGLLSGNYSAETSRTDLLKQNLETRFGLQLVKETKVSLRLVCSEVNTYHSEFKTKDLTTELKTVKDSYNTSLRTKTIIEHEDIFDKMPKIDHIAPNYKMSFDQILNKPFLIKTVNWATSSSVSFVELDRLAFPSAITTNALAQVPFDSATFYQMRACVMLQVSGTPMHQGCLLVAAIPHNAPAVTTPNSILAAPHVFLNANEASSVCLELPMYYLTNLARTQANGVQFSENYFGPDICDLVLFIMNPLTTGAGSSTTISVSIHCMVQEAEFYVPKNGRLSWQSQCGILPFKGIKVQTKQRYAITVPPVSAEYTVAKIFRLKKEGLMEKMYALPTTILDDTAKGMKKVCGDIIDYTRATIRTMTGFHNPIVTTIKSRNLVTFNTSTNAVDIPQHIDLLDNHVLFSRIVDDYYFRTSVDEMDMSYILSKPTYLGTFRVNSTSVVGENLFAHPITPFVEAGVLGGTASFTYASPMRTIYENSRFWKGGLKLHIQAVATNFHFCKIAVFKNYQTPSLALVNTQVPAYVSVHNINLDTMEFSAGGQVQTIDLPFCSTNRQLECTKDFLANAFMHGMVYGYLVQPLTFNGNVPLSISFNVYMSGAPDLTFSGYGTDPIDLLGGNNPVYPPITAGLSTPLYYQTSDSETRPINLGKYDTVDTGTPTMPHGPVKTIGELAKDYIVNCSDDPIKTTTHTIVQSTRRTDVPLLDQVNRFIRESSNGIAMTTVGESDQSALQSDIMGYSDPPAMGVCPNVSIRDYVRRFHPSGPIIFTPTTLRGSLALPLRFFFRSSVSASPLTSLTSMYYAMSGGIKLKFKVLGACAAAVTFLPPGVYATGSENVLRSSVGVVGGTGDANVTNTNNLRMGVRANEVAHSLPMRELQDYTRPYNQTANSIAGRVGSAIVLEVAVPHMNMNNLVGGCSKWLFSAPTDIPEEDYGTVILHYEASYDNNAYQQLNITPYLALSDETRLGFLSYQPVRDIIKVQSSVMNGPLARASTPFLCAASSGSVPVAGAPKLNELSSVPYFFNP